MNAAQILEQRGFEKGKLEGKLEGQLEGQAQVLERLLIRRFGQLPDAINNRLSGATAEQLELWTDRILFADSIDAVFTEK
jgi:predicted transposase YdaD